MQVHIRKIEDSFGFAKVHKQFSINKAWGSHLKSYIHG
ncbi:hypothetical protein CU016_1896 [Enterococcus lactis]|nr:hypothetical protein [Enterococcus lactis]